jgi:hypothetical protein
MNFEHFILERLPVPADTGEDYGNGNSEYP